MKLLLVIIPLFMCLNMKAGEVYLCKSYSPKGGPQQTKSEWKAKKDNICIVYHHDTYYRASGNYKLSIAKRVEKYYFARFINKEIKVVKGTKWTVAYYTITEPGDYVISIIDDSGYILGEQPCVVK